MNLNLILDPEKARAGHLNICPLDTDQTDIVKGDVFNLDHSIDDGELDVVVAHGVLDRAPRGTAMDCLANWMKKLRKGGILSISVIDGREVSREIVDGRISSWEADEILFGDGKTAYFSLLELADHIRERGYKILTKRVDDRLAFIMCERI